MNGVPPVSLPVDARSVATARAVLRETLHRYGVRASRVIPDDTAGDAALMLSEVVTNAVRHTRGLLLLDVTVDGDTLHVEVVDDAPGLPALGRLDHYTTGGRGMTIVDVLADRWGCTPDGDRKTVWFDLALIRSADAPQPPAGPEAPPAGVDAGAGGTGPQDGDGGQGRRAAESLARGVLAA